MNKLNLIRLGVAISNNYNIGVDYRIIEISKDDTNNSVRLLINKSLSNYLDNTLFDDFDTEDIRLKQWVSPCGQETAYVGYSDRSRTLVIKEL